MTSYPDAATGQLRQGPPVAPAAQRPGRPGVLFAALGVAVLSALAAIVDGVMIMSGGRELAADLAAKVVASVTGESADAVKAGGGMLFDAAVEQAQSSLQVRGVMTIVFGVLLLICAALMQGAAAWARVLVTLTALLNALIALRVATDDEGGTGAMQGVAWLAVATAIVAIVLAWLPANHRYAKARKGF
ncbi:hypothetical protein [Amycolatopsis sp. NPDC059021]|uniref:hypothetical protein n=1 Tax=Amycolatopsis sp. NPDC059021 TaxID=3346704 RepID=UPI00366D8316